MELPPPTIKVCTVETVNDIELIITYDGPELTKETDRTRRRASMDLHIDTDEIHAYRQQIEFLLKHVKDAEEIAQSRLTPESNQP